MRLCVVCPSWVGDVCMATPALRLVREALPGAFIGALVKPPCEVLLAGTGLVDEVHIRRDSGVMGPKHTASKMRPRRYDTALLLTNSFSTALATRVAGIPQRVGYERDGRGLLLTHRLDPEKRCDGDWAMVPAVDYYWRVASAMLGREEARAPVDAFMELARTDAEHDEAQRALTEAGVGDRTYAVLNPGGNNKAKRWPAERFAAVARWLRDERGLAVVVNGSPAERELCDRIAALSDGAAASLPAIGMSFAAVKAVVGGAAVLVTNDTGPRHIAVAMGVPTVTLFGPTDHRWTTVPTRPGTPEVLVLADPTLPESESANDHPERCSIERIELDRVREAVAAVLAPGGGTVRNDGRAGEA